MPTIEDIRRAMRRRPFLPFRIVMRGGETHEIPDPDFIAVSPIGKSAVLLDNQGMRILNVRLIAELVVPGLPHEEEPLAESPT
jgi:hypothetical protein